MALWTRGRGAHAAPSGVTTRFHRQRTVIVSPSADTVAHMTLPPPAARRFAHQPGGSRTLRPCLRAYTRSTRGVMRLLAREQLVPGRAGYVDSPGEDYARSAFRKSHADRSHSPAKNPVRKMMASGKLGATEPHPQINAVMPINV
jgi:hypothetical protein